MTGYVKVGYSRGEHRPTSKLKEADVRAIRASSDPGPALAKRYGCSTVNIHYIRTGKRWRYLLD